MSTRSDGDKTRILICEDNAEELRILQNALTEFFSQNSHLGEPEYVTYSCGEDFLSTGDIDGFDIAFLDIYMKEINGMGVAKALRKTDSKVRIIFLTTSIDFAIDSYDVQASGYLLKPLQVEKMQSLLLKILQDRPRPKLAVKHRKELRYLFYDDIIYAESRGRNLTIHLNNRPTITINEKLDILQATLKSPRFLRCHQSFLVNMDYVIDVDDAMFILSNKETVLIRQRDYAKMKSEYHKYFVEHNLRGGEDR